METSNWRTSIIMVHVAFLYPIGCSMIHATHHCAPIQGVLPRSPLQHPTGLEILSHTIWVYMGRDGCLKAMTQLSNVCGASPVSNQILFFGGHDSYLDECAQKQMKCRKIQPFLLKAYDSIKDQTNNNGPNEKLKYLYNVTKSTWMLKYGTKKFLPRHMNSVLD